MLSSNRVAPARTVDGWADDVLPATRSNLADRVYETIKALLMDGVIQPDSRINVDEVARRLEVSQSPIREALARLEADRLVVKEAFRGYSATPLLTEEQLGQLYDFRLVIEPWAAGQASERMTAENHERLLAELASCPQAPEGEEYVSYRAFAAHDARFHDLLLEIAGNEPARQALAGTHCHLHMHRVFYAGQAGTAALKEHRHIVDAAKDATGAASAMRAHLGASRQRLLNAVERGTHSARRA